MTSMFVSGAGGEREVEVDVDVVEATVQEVAVVAQAVQGRCG